MTRESAATCVQLPDEIMPLSFNHLLPIGGVCVCVCGGGGGGGGGIKLGNRLEKIKAACLFNWAENQEGEGGIKVLHVKGRKGSERGVGRREVALSPGPSQILSRSHGEKSAEGLES